MNQKQEILEERVVALEERLSNISDQLEGLPEALSRVIQAALNTPRPMPVEGAGLIPGASAGPGPGPHAATQDQARHTHLHPNDAAALAVVSRPSPSWSATNVAANTAAARGAFLAPLAPRSGSFDA